VKKLMTGLVAILTLVAVAMSAMAAMDEDSIRERTMPVGSVCVQGEDCGSASAAAPSGPRDPEELYSSVCAACHTTGALNAPKLGVAAEWNPRLDKGIEQVIANAIAGIGAMPAKGTCATCSDEDIANAVEYMVSQSQ
jgi:cytochrome c5